ncbi:MAG: phosphotransferase [Bacteroidales bacterium]|jgi:aminoglycoside/choline kinase family phosphotransferase|nr:phosphotransferase [Bacteroidales bacterium]
MGSHTEDLENLFLATFKQEIRNMVALEASGSNRKYYRIKSDDFSAIGAYNEDEEENKAFLALSRRFLNKRICVPTVYNEDLSKKIYLISDLGNRTLYQFLCEIRKDDKDFSKQRHMYEWALKELIKIQFAMHQEPARDEETKAFSSMFQQFNSSATYPRTAFDKQAMLWDMNYFKYYFLKLAHIPFDEQLLEKDFHALADFLTEADASFFLYRDFQSRNIMIHRNTLFFIDYQGGKKGALQYDVASLLYDSKADIPQEIRQQLVDYYVDHLLRRHPKAVICFRKYYDAFVFIRIMQTMGAYGYRGFYEGKKHFLQSIPYVLKNLKWLLENVRLPVEIPTLWRVYHQLIESVSLQQYELSPLKISVNSFSYKKTIPTDKSEHGGGFVFDCRCLPNPGRYDEYKILTGKDKEVVDFLDNTPEINKFFEHVTSIIDMAVQNYNKRQFQHLMISFGCTGGRHRSVYFAERLQKYLNKRYSVDTEINHYNLDK